MYTERGFKWEDIGVKEITILELEKEKDNVLLKLMPLRQESSLSLHLFLKVVLLILYHSEELTSFRLLL